MSFGVCISSSWCSSTTAAASSMVSVVDMLVIESCTTLRMVPYVFVILWYYFAVEFNFKSGRGR